MHRFTYAALKIVYLVAATTIAYPFFLAIGVYMAARLGLLGGAVYSLLYVWFSAVTLGLIEELAHKHAEDDAGEAPVHAKLSHGWNWGLAYGATCAIAFGYLDVPLEYFTELRISLSGIAVVLGAIAVHKRRFGAALSAVPVVWLFNPIVPIELGSKQDWIGPDIVAAIALWAISIRLRRFLPRNV